MVDLLYGVEVIHTPIKVISRGGVHTDYPTCPICVPTTIIPFRGRFVSIPEVIPTLVNRGLKPSMLSSITIGITKKNEFTST